MAATFTGNIIRKARGAGGYIIQTPSGTNVLFVGSTGKLSVFGAAGATQAAAITAPNAAGAGYVQADQTSIVTAVNAIRAVLQNIGFTL
jgi:hypothetical protein